jgi:hypothetical protein
LEKSGLQDLASKKGFVEEYQSVQPPLASQNGERTPFVESENPGHDSVTVTDSVRGHLR